MALDTQLPGINVPSFSAIVDGDDTLGSFLACSTLYNEQQYRLQSFAAGTFATQIAQAATVSVPGQHQIRATIDGQNQRCDFGPTLLQMSSSGSGRTNVGLRVRNLRVAIFYVAIYRSP